MEDINYTPDDLKDHDAVAAVIKDKNGKILVQDHVKYGFLTIPLGKARQGQTPEEGMKEELFEECNIVAEEMKKIATKEFMYNRKGKEVKLNLHIYEITYYSGNLENREPEKHRWQKFIDLDEIKKAPHISDATKLYLEILGFKREAKIN
jgi:8-oxo-dGTP pyrophosphatase MutT (NUDIX family)